MMKKRSLLSLCLVMALCTALVTGCAAPQNDDTGISTDSASAVSSEESSVVSEALDDGSAAEEPTDAADLSDSTSVDAPQTTPADVADATPKDAPRTGLEVDASEAFDGAYLFLPQQDGIYTFSCANAEGSEEITWVVYALKEEFDDAIRFLPQAMSSDVAPSGEVVDLANGTTAEITLSAGSYVYCTCSFNAFTGGEPQEGLSTLTIAPAP